MADDTEHASPLPENPGAPDHDAHRFSAEHRLARSRRLLSPQETLPRSPLRRGKMRRRLLVSVVLMVGAAILVPLADVANPDFPEANDIEGRITATWEAIVRNGADPEDAAAANGLQIFTYEAGDKPFYVLTHPAPTSAGVCYALLFGSGTPTTAGILLEAAPGCTPQLPGLFESAGSWESVLPSERMTPWWFVPLMLVIVGYVLFVAIDIVVAIVTRSGQR